MKRLFLLPLCAFALHCTAAMPSENLPDAAAAAEERGIPYPQPDAHHQIEQLHIEILRLGKQIEQLQQRVQRLEQRNAPPVRKTRPTAAVGEITVTQNLMPSENRAATPLAEAQQQYRSGRYRSAIATLRHAESGGNGGEEDRQSMLLLIQAHKKLNNCQSVIHIGNRYAARFRRSAEAADALFAVGQCQWKLQQKDIARDTWRKLQRLYPAAAAAKRAEAELKR